MKKLKGWFCLVWVAFSLGIFASQGQAETSTSLHPLLYYWDTTEQIYLSGDLKKAKKIAEEGLRQYPSDAKLLKLKEIIERGPFPMEKAPPEVLSAYKAGKFKNSKMFAFYERGILNYQAKNYQRAILYLKKALDEKDKVIPRYFYAEADAMLGIIYQYYVPDRSKAYGYYQAALKVDPLTKTARKHLNQVKPPSKTWKKKKRN